MASLAAIVESDHRFQLLTRSEFNDKLATPSDDANNTITLNVFRISPLVKVLYLPEGNAANVILDDGWYPPTHQTPRANAKFLTDSTP